MPDNIMTLPFPQIEDLCRRYQVRELAVFGWFVRDDFGDHSDLDLLVEFADEAEIGFLELAALARELSEVTNHRVDLVPKNGLKPSIREQVLNSARILYVAKSV